MRFYFPLITTSDGSVLPWLRTLKTIGDQKPDFKNTGIFYIVNYSRELITELIRKPVLGTVLWVKRMDV